HSPPESTAAQLSPVVSVEIRLRLARAGAHPGIHQHQVRHARILRDIHQRGRCAVAQSPETHFAYVAFRLLERVDRGADIGRAALEARELPVAVAHARKIEAQHRGAAGRERARQQHELAVTADAILRSAHYDHHATRYTAWGLRPVQNTDQALALRLNADRLLGIQAPGLARHSTVASSSGGTTATSGVAQK